MVSQIPKISLSNGTVIPAIGLGTWKAQPGIVKESVKTAISNGYRLIDCAHCYGNEREVGEALVDKISDGTVKREELFITSKLWQTDMAPSRVPAALHNSMKNLQLDYLDFYLMHWPCSLREGDQLFPSNENGDLDFRNVDYVDTWKALEDCARQGLVKTIGICNFNINQLKRLLAAAKIKPTVHQAECHPYLNNTDVVEFCRNNNIHFSAYSPLGSPDRPIVKENDPVLLDDPVIAELAVKYGKNKGQILIRYQFQRGNSVLVKSVSAERIKSNIDVFDFNISDDDMAKINSLNRGVRYLIFPRIMKHPHYPF